MRVYSVVVQSHEMPPGAAGMGRNLKVPDHTPG